MQRIELNESEIKSLRQFRFTSNDDGKSSISYLTLIDPLQIKDVLEKTRKKLGAPNQRVAASLLMKRMAFYAVIHLYAMSAMEKRLIVDVKNMKLIDNESTDLWLPEFYLGPFKIEKIGENRIHLRDEVIHEVFSKCLNPLVLLLSKDKRLSKRILWENIALYIFWLYEKVIGAVNIESKVAEDFTYIIHEAPGELFGSYKNNPITEFAGKQIYIEEAGEEIRIRKTCCLSHLLKGSEKSMCKTCPLNKKK